MIVPMHFVQSKSLFTCVLVTNCNYIHLSLFQLLARLLKSKHPEDLQAANRLIKNMVKQDAERVDKVTKRTTELETVSNNVKLLHEMLQHYNPDDSTDADKDIMKVGHFNTDILQMVSWQIIILAWSQWMQYNHSILLFKWMITYFLSLYSTL